MKIYVLGIGPGGQNFIIPEAVEAIKKSNCIIGYDKYITFIEHLTKEKEVLTTGMTGEIERCKIAFEKAKEGKIVSVVSGGDSGIYGMASLMYELSRDYESIEIEVVPGITAAVAVAAVVGSPLSNDFAVVSLSDLLTPIEVIRKRLKYASMGDFVICIYNPSSKKRDDYLEKACNIILEHRNKDTPCAYVRNATRKEGESYSICSLEELKNVKVDMFTTVIIGNSQTEVIKNKLVTKRGYKLEK